VAKIFRVRKPLLGFGWISQALPNFALSWTAEGGCPYVCEQSRVIT
jgi:hypothetical protein